MDSLILEDRTRDCEGKDNTSRLRNILEANRCCHLTGWSFCLSDDIARLTDKARPSSHEHTIAVHFRRWSCDVECVHQPAPNTHQDSACKVPREVVAYGRECRPVDHDATDEDDDEWEKTNCGFECTILSDELEV